MWPHVGRGVGPNAARSRAQARGSAAQAQGRLSAGPPGPNLGPKFCEDVDGEEPQEDLPSAPTRRTHLALTRGTGTRGKDGNVSRAATPNTLPQTRETPLVLRQFRLLRAAREAASASASRATCALAASWAAEGTRGWDTWGGGRAWGLTTRDAWRLERPGRPACTRPVPSPQRGGQAGSRAGAAPPPLAGEQRGS